MHGVFQPKINVDNPVAEQAIGERLKPGCGQSHNEDGRGRDSASKNHHGISREPLSQSANNWNEKNHKDTVNVPKPPYRSALAQFTNSERRKNIIHLHEDQLQERDQNEKAEEAIEPILSK